MLFLYFLESMDNAYTQEPMLQYGEKNLSDIQKEVRLFRLSKIFIFQ